MFRVEKRVNLDSSVTVVLRGKMDEYYILPDVTSYVQQVVSDDRNKFYNGALSTVLIDPATWSDNQAPHAGASYVKGPKIVMNIGRPGDKNGEYRFPGNRLVIQGDGTQWNKLMIDVAHFICDDLMMFPGSWMVKDANSYSGSVQGKLTAYSVDEDDYVYIRMACWGGKLDIRSDLYGNGNIALVGRGGDVNADGVFVITNANPNFVGTWTVGIDVSPFKGVQPDPDGYRQVLRIDSPLALGGALFNFDWKALYLHQYSELEPLKSVAFNDATRGIAIGDHATFKVNDGLELAIATQLTLDGELRKTGAGTLVMGGALKYLDAAGSPSNEPRSGSNLFHVVSGVVKPASTNAFDGMKITLSEEATLAYDIAPADAAVAQYGILNVKNAVDPIVAEGSSVNVRLDGTPESTEFTLALATLASTELADAFAARLCVGRLIGYEYLTRIRRNADSTVTMLLDFRKKGFQLIVR